jgi:hypothetical protein
MCTLTGSCKVLMDAESGLLRCNHSSKLLRTLFGPPVAADLGS